VARRGRLVLGQKVVIVSGNVERAEALFLNRIDPRRPGTAISRYVFDGLWATITRMLHEGVAANRIVTIDPDEFDIPTGLARRGDTTYVYHRDVCLVCGSPIMTVQLGGRPCYYCPVDQPD